MKFRLLPALLFALGVFAVEPPQLKPGGEFAWEGFNFALAHYNAEWRQTLQNSHSVKGTEVGGALRGVFSVTSGKFDLEERVTAVPDGFDYSIRLRAEKALATNALALAVNLPAAVYAGATLTVDGKPVVLQNLETNHAFFAGDMRETVIPLAEGRLVITGSCLFTAELNRMRNSGNDPRYTLRFHLAPRLQATAGGALDLAFRVEAYPPGFAVETVLPLAAEAGLRRIQAGKEWRAVEFLPGPVAPGSALDLSNFLDAPAGKYGKVLLRNGRFEFENRPGQRFRLFGTNLCAMACFPDRAAAERLAETLAAVGYNAVRFHHFDNPLTVPGSPAIADRERFDRMQYLMACLRRRGIYYTVDLYTVRRPTAELAAAGTTQAVISTVKSRMPLDPAITADIQEFARELLTRVNPHTGLALKDDPALLPFNIINENSLFANIANAGTIGRYREAFRREFPKEEATGNRLGRFVLGKQQEIYGEMKRFLTSIGCERATSDCSVGYEMALLAARSRQDYVDNHPYHALYITGITTPEQALLPPSASNFVFPLLAAPTRVFGKGFTLGESQICYANSSRMQYAALLSLIAGMQGWDGFYHYAFSHTLDRLAAPQPAERLNYGSDPLALFGDRIGRLLFLEMGDELELPVKIPYAVTSKYLESKVHFSGGPQFPESYRDLGLSARIGGVLADGDSPEFRDAPFLVVPKDMEIPACLKPYRILRDDEDLQKALPEAALREPGVIRAATSRAECLILEGGVEKAQGKLLAVAGNRVPSVVFLGAVDGKPFASSGRMLFLYLTDLVNSGFTRRNNLILEQGGLPLLVRQGALEVTLRTERQPQVWALGRTGARRKPLPVVQTPEGWRFQADSFTERDVYYAFEVTL